MVATSPMLVSGFWNVVQASEKLVFKYLILTKLTQAQGSSGYHTGQHHPIPFTHWFLVLQRLCMLVSSPLKIIPHRAVKGMLLLSRFSHVWLCATPYMAAHQATLSLGFSRQEHWSGLPFPSPMQESEKWKWIHWVVSNSQRPHGLQPTRLLRPWDFPGKSTGVGAIALKG